VFAWTQLALQFLALGFPGQLLDNGKRLLGIGIARNSTDRRNDSVVGGDNEKS
jgi:hypothetical protein